MTINRHKFAEEMILREQVRNTVRHILVEEKNKTLNEEKQLRKIIRSLLKEEEFGETDEAGDKTLKNFLEQLFGSTNIVATLQDAYLGLGRKEERRSFRAHILASISHSFNILDSYVNTESFAVANEELMGVEEDVGIEIENPDRLPGQEEEETLEPSDITAKTDFTLAGEDETGRNVALGTPGLDSKGVVDGVWTSIKKIYNMIGTTSEQNKEDRIKYKEYVLDNIKKYFDQFEDEATSNIEEPEIKEPEGAVEPTSIEEPVSGEEPEDELADLL